jgi:hypothetical protein
LGQLLEEGDGRFRLRPRNQFRTNKCLLRNNMMLQRPHHLTRPFHNHQLLRITVPPLTQLYHLFDMLVLQTGNTHDYPSPIPKQ